MTSFNLDSVFFFCSVFRQVRFCLCIVLGDFFKNYLGQQIKIGISKSVKFGRQEKQISYCIHRSFTYCYINIELFPMYILLFASLSKRLQTGKFFCKRSVFTSCDFELCFPKSDSFQIDSEPDYILHANFSYSIRALYLVEKQTREENYRPKRIAKKISKNYCSKSKYQAINFNTLS